MNKSDTLNSNPKVPLNSIRVFVEASRHLNFSWAATALGMTQGGVSQHMATLERVLGQRLFNRNNSSLELTDAARLYFDAVRHAMFTLESETRKMMSRPVAASQLNVRTSLPPFAMTVLIPALKHFSAESPISVDVMTSSSQPAAGDYYDVLVSRNLVVKGADRWLLASEELVCVGSPDLRRRYADVPMPKWPLLTSRSRPDTFADWASQHALIPDEIKSVAGFDYYFLAIPAAIAGMGFLVVPRCLIVDPLFNGQLLEAPSAIVRGRGEYSAYVNPNSSAHEPSQAFCNWLTRYLKSSSGVVPDAAMSGPPIPS